MVTAFIPVRGGSKSIPLKNIRPFCGKPLVWWSLKALEDCAAVDRVVVATDSDEINILSCFLAKKFGTKNTIARIRNQEYEKQLRFMRTELGLSMAINPEKEVAREIYRERDAGVYCCRVTS